MPANSGGRPRGLARGFFGGIIGSFLSHATWVSRAFTCALVCVVGRGSDVTVAVRADVLAGGLA